MSTQSSFTMPVLASITLVDIPVHSSLDSFDINPIVKLRLATQQWLKITNSQNHLLEVLQQPPYNASLIERVIYYENRITIQIDSQFITQIEALPDVQAVTIESPLAQPTVAATIERLPRGTPMIGTRVPPIEPPGYNGD